MNCCVCTVLIFVTIICAVIGQRDEFYGRNEDACSRNGGLCILGTECDVLKRTAPGLCPEQQGDGFECCNGVPKNENRCRKHGGECAKKETFCAPQLTYLAVDCAADEHCCILI